jgi:hypothetical protein
MLLLIRLLLGKEFHQGEQREIKPGKIALFLSLEILKHIVASALLTICI